MGNARMPGAAASKGRARHLCKEKTHMASFPGLTWPMPAASRRTASCWARACAVPLLNFVAAAPA